MVHTCFTSYDFMEFARCNHIHHVTTAPYHRSSHGLAERAVQTFKLGMKKQVNGTLQTNCHVFCSTIGWHLMPQLVSSAELLLKCQSCSYLDVILPSIKGNVRQQQQKQKCQHDVHSRDLLSNQVIVYVLVRNFSITAESHWLPGVIKELTACLHYKLNLLIWNVPNQSWLFTCAVANRNKQFKNETHNHLH